MDLPLLPVWGILDWASLLIGCICVPITLYVPITFVAAMIPYFLFRIKLVLSRQIRIRLISGKVIKIPIGQKSEASEFLREFNYPPAEIQKNDDKEIGRDEWFRRKEWSIRIWTFVTLLLLALGGYMLQDYWNNQYIHLTENEEPEREQAISEEISDSKEDKDSENVQTPNVQENDEDEHVDLEGMDGQPEEPQKNTTQENQSQEYIFPDSNSRYLSEEEIRSVDADKLRIARNEILARHGYIFNDEELNMYFTSTSWYQGTVPSDEFHMDWILNDFEKKNVELIKFVEESNRNSSAQTGETLSDADVAGGYANINELAETLIKNNEDIAGQKVAFCGWGFYHDSEKIQLRYFEGENIQPLVTAYYDSEKIPTMTEAEPFDMANSIVWGTVRGISDDYGIEIDLDAMNVSDQDLWFTQFYAEDYREVFDAYEARAAEWGGKITLEGTVQFERGQNCILVLENGDHCILWGASSGELSSVGDIAVCESFNGVRVKVYGKLLDGSPTISVDYIAPIVQ